MEAHKAVNPAPIKVHHVVVVSELVTIAYLDTRGDISGRPESPIDEFDPIALLVDEHDFEHLHIGRCVHVIDPYVGESEPFYVLHTDGDTFTVQRMVSPLSDDGKAVFDRNDAANES